MSVFAWVIVVILWGDDFLWLLARCIYIIEYLGLQIGNNEDAALALLVNCCICPRQRIFCWDFEDKGAKRPQLLLSYINTHGWIMLSAFVLAYCLPVTQSQWLWIFFVLGDSRKWWVWCVCKEENLTLAVTFLVSLLINTTSHYGWVDYRWYGV